jgi:hypothetical protein
MNIALVLPTFVELNIVQNSRECSVDHGLRKKCADP